MGRTKLLLNPQLKYEKRESGILYSNNLEKSWEATAEWFSHTTLKLVQ